MRIFGYVLFGIGLVFLVLFVFADLGGAHLNGSPFLVSLFLLYLGWTIAQRHRGSASKPE